MNRKTMLALVGCLTAAMCLGAAKDGVAGKSNDTLNVAFGFDFENVDPYLGATREGISIAHQVFDALLFRDPKTLEYKPALATSYKWQDNTTIDFELRQGVVFHNGEKFDADDVVFTLNFAIKPDSGNRSPHLVSWIKSAEKLGEYKVRVTLKEPFAPALDYFSLPIRIYPSEYFNSVGPSGMVRNPIGTGPYKVARMEPGKSILLERFAEHYAGSPKSGATISKIFIRIIPELNTQMAELISGGLDWIWRVPADQAERLKSMPGVSIVVGETLRIEGLSFDAAGNAGKSPMQDIRVRKAIAHAINRKAIRDALIGGNSRVVDAACHPAQFGCTNDVQKYEYDPEKARRLLAEAGYPGGFQITLYSWSPRQNVEAVIGDLRRVGIIANPQILQNPAVRTKMLNNEVQFVQYNWGSDSVADVIASAGVYFSFGHYDIARDEKVRDLLKQATTTVVVQERLDLNKQALQRIADQAYMLPISTWISAYATSKDLVFEPSLDEFPRFYMSRWR